MKKIHSLNELEQLKMLSESIVRIEEAGDAGPEVYEDMAGDGGDFIAFASDFDYQIYVNALDFAGHGAAYGSADNTFESRPGIKAQKVVPAELISKLNTALDNDDEEAIESLIDDSYDYFWTETTGAGPTSGPTSGTDSLQPGDQVQVTDIDSFAKWYDGGRDYDYWTKKLRSENNFYVVGAVDSDGELLVDFNGIEIYIPQSLVEPYTGNSQSADSDNRGSFNGISGR